MRWLTRSSCSAGTAAVGAQRAHAGVHLALQAGDPHHRELVQDVGGDREETKPLEQRIGAGCAASSNTRSLNASHDSSRLKNRSGDCISARRLRRCPRRRRSPAMVASSTVETAELCGKCSPSRRVSVAGLGRTTAVPVGPEHAMKGWSSLQCQPCHLRKDDAATLVASACQIELGHARFGGPRPAARAPWPAGSTPDGAADGERRLGPGPRALLAGRTGARDLAADGAAARRAHPMPRRCARSIQARRAGS